MENVGIKFKKFVYIYNFTCFELIWIDLKNQGKCRNQKNFSIFCIYKTKFNVELRDKFNELRKYYLSPHLSNINLHFHWT